MMDTGVLIYLILQTILLLFGTYALLGALQILRRWNFQATSPRQYSLEKRSYLVMLVIVFLTFAKIALFPFFAYTLDHLATMIPGAMCAAGVVEGVWFGEALLVLKLGLLFSGGVWLLLNRLDLQATDYPFMRIKSVLFVVIYLLLLLESGMDVAYLQGLSTKTPVQCCSVIYGVSGEQNALPLGLGTATLLLLFYLLFALQPLLLLQRQGYLLALANGVFLFVGYYAVVHFFGTYIYELPTHKCPFCMLQREYYYVGYLLWGSLFLGVFFAAAAAFLQATVKKPMVKLQRYSVWANALFTLLCSYFVVSYWLKNGVLL